MENETILYSHQCRADTGRIFTLFESKTSHCKESQLKALTVTYYKDCAVLNGRLPSNNESADIIEKLFPKIKKELNYLDKDYQFNDIIRDPEGKNFSSVAKCNIGEVYPIKNNDG